MLEIIPSNSFGLVIVRGDVGVLGSGLTVTEGRDNEVVDRCNRLARPSVNDKTTPPLVGLVEGDEGRSWLIEQSYLSRRCSQGTSKTAIGPPSSPVCCNGNRRAYIL